MSRQGRRPDVRRSASPAMQGRPESDDVTHDFFREAYRLIRTVPEGRVCTYGHIAKLMGRPQNSRLVGQALKHLPSRLARPFIDGELIEERHGSESGQETGPGEAEFEDFHRQHRIANPDFVPWHRIISSSGVISPRGNSASLERQAVMLRAEGVVVRNAAGPADEPGYGPDAFGLAGMQEGGRVSLARFGWFPEPPARSRAR